MKSLRSLPILIVSLFLLLDTASAQHSKRQSQTVPLSERGEVVINNYRGTIHVDTWARAEARVEVVVESGDEEVVEATDIVIDSAPGRLEVATEIESRRSLWGMVAGESVSHPSAHIRITMPATAHLTIRDYRSETRIAGIQRGADIETYRGTIEGKDLGGSLQIETYRGDVRLAGIRGGLTIDTYRGNVNAHFASLDGDVRIETYRGDVELDLPADAAFRVDADTSRRGRIRSDFNLGRESQDDRIRVDVNGGGPLIHFRTYRGELALNSL